MPFPVTATLLDAVVLAIVAREDIYGYKITQEVRRLVGISESTLYPVLRRLQKDGFLTAYNEMMTNRVRRYYHVTPAGREKLREYRADWTAYRDALESVLGEGEGKSE